MPYHALTVPVLSATILLCGLSTPGVFGDVLAMPAGQTSLEFVGVGNPGNLPDVRYSYDGVLLGAVGYDYRMGKYEITAAQYTQFLNAVAKVDTYGLYQENMGDPVTTNVWGCNITRSTGPEGFIYAVGAEWANRPVNWVSWADALRFANWMTNGQPSGSQDLTTTEGGSYYLNGANTIAQLLTVTRQTSGRYFVPSEDEWYKAAYHQNNGATGDYWEYATGTSVPPSNILVAPDTGNSANYFDTYLRGNGTYTLGGPYWRTEVGAFANSVSPYGTLDQNGNVFEWQDTVLGANVQGAGGSFIIGDVIGAGTERQYPIYPLWEYNDTGFRIMEIPEPASLGLLAAGVLGLLVRRARSSR